MPQLPLEYEATTRRNPRGFARSAQLVAVLLGWLTAPLWGVLALVHYPWIVIADSNFDTVRAMEQASKASFALAFVSAAGIVLASGLMSRATARWCAALALCAGHAMAACYLYRGFELTGTTTLISLSLQAIGVGLIIAGAKFGLPESD